MDKGNTGQKTRDSVINTIVSNWARSVIAALIQRLRARPDLLLEAAEGLLVLARRDGLTAFLAAGGVSPFADELNMAMREVAGVALAKAGASLDPEGTQVLIQVLNQLEQSTRDAWAEARRIAATLPQPTT